MKVRDVIRIEWANGNYSAYSPDLLGCVATGKTVPEVEQNMHEAMGLHVRGLIEDGFIVPETSSSKCGLGANVILSGLTPKLMQRRTSSEESPTWDETLRWELAATYFVWQTRSE